MASTRLQAILPSASAHGTLASAMKTRKDYLPARMPERGISGWLLLLLVGLTMVSALTACGGGQTEVSQASPTAVASPILASTTHTPAAAASSTASMPGEVTLWLDWDPAELRVLERIIKEYQVLHPGSRFRVIYFPADQLEGALLEEIEPEAMPSLVLGPSNWAAGLEKAGFLRDVSQVILPDLRQALHPFALAQVERQSMMVGLPIELKGTVLYRNRQLSEEPANTLERMVELSQQALLEGGQGSSFDLGFRRAAPLVRTCRGDILSDPEVVPISQPAGLCWLRLLDRLGRAGPVTFDSDDDLELFAAGETLWLLDSTDQIVALESALGEENVTIDPWPLYEATGESMLGSVWTENAYFPSQATDQDFEAAWSFATYLLVPENQQMMSQARGVRHLPAIASIELQEPLLQQAGRALDTGVAETELAVDEQVSRELFTAIRLVVADGGDPELALGLALEEIRQARIPTATPTRTPSPTLSPTPSNTPVPTPPPG